MTAPLLVHVTTTDISLALLLGPQLRAFRDAGYEVVTASASGPYAEALEAEGFEHVALRHATRSNAPHRDALALAELYRLFRRRRPAIVHTHNPKPGIYGRVAARAARVPCVVHTTHGLYATPEDSRLRRTAVYTAERIAARCSDAELVQNPEDVETLARLGVPREKLHLLGNGVDLSRFDPVRLAPRRAAVRAALGLTDGQVVIGAVGRLVVEKGYRELFDAAARLRETHPEAVVVVIGPADPAKADALTQEEIARAEAAGVRLLGERAEVEELYTAMDAYVLASYREGFPRSAMEAAAMGLPVVGTQIRGTRQVVEDGVSGLLVPPRRAVPLAEALARIVDDGELRRRMGAAGREKAMQEFDDRKVIDITLAVYGRLLGTAAPLRAGRA